MAGLADIATKNAGEALAFGLGFALSRALTPAAVGLEQEAWKVAPTRVPPGEQLAAGFAQGQVDESTAKEWASMSGYGDDAFAALVDIANVGPAVGQAMAAWRRGELTDVQFNRALHRAAIEEEWWPAIRALRFERLEPAEIAKALHRGIMRGADLLVMEPPLTPGKVPIVPPSPIDPIEEAKAAGVDAERLRVLTGNAGLPPGVIQMTQLLNRNVITVDDFLRGVGESNMRNEWGPAIAELRRHLLTPGQYVQARLRGWIDDPAMHSGAALSGMTPTDTDLLAKLSGRPLSFRQAFIGTRRGGRLDGPTDGIDLAFLRSLQQSNVRPEWYQLAWSQRYTYPSAFVLRALAQAGELTVAETEQVLLYVGWEPTFARKIATRWAGSAGAGGKEETRAELGDEYAGGFVTEAEYRAALGLLGYTGEALDREVHLGDARRVKRYREKLVDAINQAYLAFKVDDAGARSELAEAGVTGEASALLLALWFKQRRFTIRDLTPAEVKKAYTRNLIDQAAAIDALEHHHYSPADAATLLQL